MGGPARGPADEKGTCPVAKHEGARGPGRDARDIWQCCERLTETEVTCKSVHLTVPSFFEE